MAVDIKSETSVMDYQVHPGATEILEPAAPDDHIPEEDSGNLLNKAVSNLKYFIYSLRLHQWSKNLLVFAALIFAGQIFKLEPVLKSITTFFLFSFIAGIVYVWNDLLDINQDKLHPIKRNRPLPAGKLSPIAALILASSLLFVSLLTSYFVSLSLTIILIIYLSLNFLYSFHLKHVVILDILIVAAGYVLRAVAGGLVINVEVSPWLLICTFFLALFLVLGKRRAELMQLHENRPAFRPILMEYNSQILDQMIGVVTAATIIGYALYTLDSQTVEKFGSYNLIYTVPFVVYGIFRYFYLIYKQKLGGSPELILIKDKHTLINIFFWLVTVLSIIYWENFK